MRRISVGALLTVLGASAAPAQSLRTPAARQIDSVFAAHNRSDGPGCAVGAYHAGEVLYARGYGIADLNQGIAIDRSTIFYIASVSKQFTAMAVAIAAEEGLLSLEDPIRRWLPELPRYTDSIRVRHLVEHTSGIRDYLELWSMSGRSGADEIPLDEALDFIIRQRNADFPPGTRWSYSNSGYVLLTEIVARASRMRFRTFAEQRIFAPLGMTHTLFHDDNSEIVPHRAESYRPTDDGYAIGRTSFALVGDGGLLTTVDDLAPWDANFYHNRLGGGGQALIDRTVTTGRLLDGTDTEYAFGLGRDRYRGLRTISHNGGFAGFRADFIRFPDQRFTVAVLCNDGSADPTALAQRVADLYLADLVEPESATSAGSPVGDRAILDRLVGRYEFAPGAVTEVTRSDSGLSAVVYGQTLHFTRGRADTVWVLGSQELTFVGRPDGRYGLLVKTLRLPEPAPPLGPPPHPDAQALAAFTGRYRSDELDSWFTIDELDGRLRIRARWAPPATAEPLAEDAFSARGMRFTFVRDRTGRVTGVVLSAGRAHDILARRADR